MSVDAPAGIIDGRPIHRVSDDTIWGDAAALRNACHDAIRHAEAICAREGLRFTEQRRQVLGALLESHVPASASCPSTSPSTRS